MKRIAAVSGLIVAAVAVVCLGSLIVLISARECTNIDVRNSVASLSQLENCTVIKGYLMIVLLTKNISASDYSNITFPALREITDFFILFDVRGLTSFKNLLPNLTVIRGRRLFLNYALAVSHMPDLEAIEFKSLVAIQRGHVYISSCPKLCFLKKVNWDRLTLSPGENHIIPMMKAACPLECVGCDSEYCWSNMVCQKFENDNVVNLAQGSIHCHPECLGGCTNNTKEGCVVCKGISSHGACVTECPSDLYYSEHHQRCYTKQECGKVRGYVHGNECNSGCPYGYTISRKVTQCVKCASECIKACVPSDGYSAFVVYSLADADLLRGCHRLNASLYIEIRNPVDEKGLVAAFETVHEIQGHIKIFSSPYLKSLRFLRNLERVDGHPLENKTFALVLYKNNNLTELWSPPDGKNVQFTNGGIYTYSNYKLCNKVVQEFTERVTHDKDKDLVQLNDQEVLCNPTRLNLEVNFVAQYNAIISWPKNQTADEVEVLYREAKYNQGEESELDDHVCTRVNWKRNLLFKPDIPNNFSHYSYNITGLKPFTKYEVLVKTFQQSDSYSARTPILRFVTSADYPTAPKLDTLEKTSDSITLTWTPRNEIQEIVAYYWLETFEQSVDLQTLDERNFCDRPASIFGVNPLEDYDDCCSLMQQEKQDDQFRRDMEDTFPCTVQSRENCHNMVTYGLRANTSRIDIHAQNHKVENLKTFTLYTFFFYACNEIGCGTYYMYSAKTNFSAEADMIDQIEACKVPESNEYQIDFQEPKTPNGAIVSYNIHLKYDNGSPDLYRSLLKCITRRQHKMANFRYVVTLNTTFDQAAVRATSLAGSVLSQWFPITSCQTSAPERGVGAIGVFIICCAICTMVAVLWVSFRRQWWKNINFNFWTRGGQGPAGAMRLEDRQVLVATFDTVTFQNTPDD